MKKHGQEETVKISVVDEHIRQLSELGVSLSDLGLLGDADILEEDKKLTEKDLIEKILTDDSYKEQKKSIEKYIKEFIKADLITQSTHRRRGLALVDENESKDDWIDGAVYILRTKQKGLISIDLDVGTNDDEEVTTVNGTDYVKMQYVSPEEFQELVDKKSKKIRYRYTIDEDTGELKIAQVKTIETKETDQSNIINSLFTADSTEVEIEKIIPIDYKTEINAYTMPYEFLIDLCLITRNPEFVYHVAMLARETQIILAVQDDTTEEHVTILEEKKYESYENTSGSSTSGASKTSDEIKKMKTEIITTTMVPNLNKEFINTWSFYKSYDYAKTIDETTTTSGPTTQKYSLPSVLPNHDPGGSREVESAYGGTETIYTQERWTGTFMVSKTTTTETKVTVTKYKPAVEKKSLEKSKQFLGLLRNSTGKCENADDCYDHVKKAIECAKKAVFDKSGKNVTYKLPGSNVEAEPYPFLRSGEQMLYNLMGQEAQGDENASAEDDATSQYKNKMDGLIEHMQYLMTLPENEPDIENLLKDFDEPISDEEYNDLNIDDIIVKTDEKGALRAPTRDELIAIITAVFSGKERENALSLVDTLISCQDQYKVNAIFVVAFGHIETNIGTANTLYVKNDNNWLSWNLGKTYATPQENVETVMRNMAKGSIYFAQGKITIKDIGYTYCPNTTKYPTQGDGWVRNVTSYVKKMYELLGIQFEQEEQGTENVDGYTVNGHTYPAYKQDSGASWSDHKFADGTMKSSGCSITSIAIVLKGYGQDVTPETIRVEVGGVTKNLQEILKNHGIESERPYRPLTEKEIITHLQSGRPIIVNVKGEWTSSTGHYMVLLDFRNKDGVNQVYVSNPGTVNSAKNGWVNLSRITNNMKNGSVLITSYPDGDKKEVPTYSFTEDKVTIKIPNLSSSKKIAWVSDAHIVADYTNRGSDVTSSESEIASRYNMMVTDDQTVHSEDLWPQIIDYINNNNFDAVIFGGDLMDYYSDNNYKVLSDGYKKLKSGIKKMYIRGSTDDHDAWTGRTNHDVSYALSKHSSLDGNSDSKYIDLGGVRIVGLNWSANASVDATKAQSLIKSATGSVILASHVPIASQTDASGLEQWCRSVHNNQVYYWANNSYKWIIGNNSSMNTLLNDYIYSNNTKVKSVLAGHVHTGVWNGNITSNVSEHIFPGAFRGIIGVVELIPE